MKSQTLLLCIIMSTCLLITFPVTASAEGASQINVGLASREVKTHFYRWTTSIYGRDTWETFDLTGISIEYLFNPIRNDTVTFGFGAGLGVFTGTYDWWVGSSQGSGDATAGELNLLTHIGWHITPDFSLLGRIGLAYMALNGDAVSSAPDPYNYDFTDEFSELYAGLGAQYNITKTIAVSLMYKTTVANLSGSTDYRRGEPENVDISSSAVVANVVFTF